jgi:hypothetical protein
MVIARKNSDLLNPKAVHRLRNKTRRLKMYWDKATFMIPNVFKTHICYQDEVREIIEFNDLSLKSILVANGPSKVFGPNSGDASANEEEEKIDSDGLHDQSFADLDMPFRLI